MAFQWMPDNELKEKLLEHLKNVCTFNHVIKFCELLISGQTLIKKSKNLIHENSTLISNLMSQSDAIYEQIKDVIATVSVKVLIQKLSESLCKDDTLLEKSNLQSFLLQTNNRNSLEYLEKLINYTNSVVELYWNSELFYGSFGYFLDPVKDITNLDRFVRCAAFQSALRIFLFILQITLERVEVSAGEKDEWRSLLLKSADVIKQFVQFDVHFHYVKFPHLLKLRSCVQCILDLFAERPIKEAILLKEFDKINDCKDILDFSINLKSQQVLPDDYEYGDEDFEDLSVHSDDSVIEDWNDSDIDESDLQNLIVDSSDDDDTPKINIKEKVPASHIWWKMLEDDDADF